MNKSLRKLFQKLPWLREIAEQIEGKEFFFIRCPHCDKTLFVETALELQSSHEFPHDDSFSITCPFCHKIITQIGLHRVQLNVYPTIRSQIEGE